KSEERSERAAIPPLGFPPSERGREWGRPTESAERLPTNVPSYVVLSRASEKPSMATVEEQECAVVPVAVAVPLVAAAGDEAAARVAVTVTRRVLRRMRSP